MSSRKGKGKPRRRGTFPFNRPPRGSGGERTNPHPHPNKPVWEGDISPPGKSAYSGIDSVIQRLGGPMYDPGAIQAEVAVQLRGTPGDPANRMSFRKFVVNVQEFRVYLAMLGSQTHVSMIHTPGVYYSLVSATSTYQGKVLAFIGDRRATKEPTPICLPTTKTWEWHTGDAVTKFDKFMEFHDVEANKGTLWTPTVGDGAPVELKVPNLVAIQNMLVDLLQNQTSSFKVENLGITGSTSGSGVWWQAKQMPTVKARCFSTPLWSPLMTRISTGGSEPASTLPSDPAPQRLRLQRRE
jgi:hypothetical protein